MHLLKGANKFGQDPPTPIWTKSKRRAVFPRETVPFQPTRGAPAPTTRAPSKCGHYLTPKKRENSHRAISNQKNSTETKKTYLIFKDEDHDHDENQDGDGNDDDNVDADPAEKLRPTQRHAP